MGWDKMHKSLDIGPLVSLFLIQFINSLYILKYLPVSHNLALLIAMGFVLVTVPLFLFAFHHTHKWFSTSASSILFWAIVVLIAIISIAVMKQFDMSDIDTNRAPAIVQWKDAILAGQYPYNTKDMPSGFPMFFIITSLFAVLGDPGYFETFGVFLFGLILYLRFRTEVDKRLVILTIFAISPALLFEFVARSDVITNMMLPLIFLVLVEKKQTSLNPWIAGLFMGAILATRSVTGVLLIPYGIYLLRKDVKQGILAGITAAITFILINLPFALWNPDHYLTEGPFAIQGGYISDWMKSVLLVGVLLTGALSKQVSHIIFFGAFTLFTGIAATFVLYFHDFGWTTTIYNNYFDITYLSFTIPCFLLTTIRYSETD